MKNRSRATFSSSSSSAQATAATAAHETQLARPCRCSQSRRPLQCWLMDFVLRRSLQGIKFRCPNTTVPSPQHPPTDHDVSQSSADFEHESLAAITQKTSATTITNTSTASPCPWDRKKLTLQEYRPSKQPPSFPSQAALLVAQPTASSSCSQKKNKAAKEQTTISERGAYYPRWKASTPKRTCQG